MRAIETFSPKREVKKRWGGLHVGQVVLLAPSGVEHEFEVDLTPDEYQTIRDTLIGALKRHTRKKT